MLGILIRRGDWTTAATLADQLGVTPRSIRSYVTAANARLSSGEAIDAWRLASDIADAHLAFTDMYYWVKSGYGAALCDAGQYRESIAVSLLAREWTLERRQPLSSLSIARSYLALGEGEAAAPYLREVHGLIGDAIFEQFDEDLEADVHAAIAGLENGGTQPAAGRPK